MSTREATIVTGIPWGQDGEEGIYYQLGSKYRRPVGNTWEDVGVVSRITVTDDLPGLHCNMERVRVFDGETVIFEAPLHSLEGVAYAPPSPALNEEQE
ncbi:hypothetical protein L0F51_00055 [Afifella sp. H1R]|uniref:hypothetical protein n=1 Tax=Afifella sp. H1R TaxID=2908841 RepID=UPI001F448EFF|nr:hypothetical protein [Afifella sp. H1R]MCF1502158.1 hypothetical protein [Afifella sp. H1R]